MTLSPLGGDQKIIGSLPCPKGVMTNNVVMNQSLGGSRHGQ